MALNAHPQAPFTALQVMQDAPVIPVIVLNDVAHAVPMALALVAGGIRILEVTLRTPQALACIESIVKRAFLSSGSIYKTLFVATISIECFWQNDIIFSSISS